jgi:hypothetical protein
MREREREREGMGEREREREGGPSIRQSEGWKGFAGEYFRSPLVACSLA